MSKSTTEKVTTEKSESKNEVVSMRQLLECGVHFGHQKKRWNPRMKRYIFTSRNGIHVIDLQQSIELIKSTYVIIKDFVKNGGSVLFVGTKKQAQDAIETEANRCGMPYVNHRWLGGTLTNYVTVRNSINRLKNLKQAFEDGSLSVLSNKEQSKQTKQMNRLSYYLDGLIDMGKTPSLVFIVDTKREQIAVDEARKLGIPICGIIDTNADPTEVDFPIPANDDAIRAIKLLCSIVSQAVIEGKEEAFKLQQEAIQKAEDIKNKDEAVSSSESKDEKGIDSVKKDTKSTIKKEPKKADVKSSEKALDSKPTKKTAAKKATSSKEEKSKVAAAKKTAK